jgi:hypothetical protein
MPAARSLVDCRSQHVTPHRLSNPQTDITETNRIHLVLFVMQNRTFGPYLAAIHRILNAAR